MKQRVRTIVLLGVAGWLHGQTQIDLRTQSKSVDFSAARSTRPVRVGNALPATCTLGELFFVQGAEGGKNLYGCTGANQWAVMSGASVTSGCGLTGCESGTCQIDSAVIPSYAGPLAVHGLVLAVDAATLGTMAAGAAGSVLMSNGGTAAPTWVSTAAWTNHGALSNLDYEHSGHTGFQAELGFTPERQLTFTGPLARNGDTVSCPGCQGGGGSAGYTQAFTTATSVTIAHGLGTADIAVECYGTDGARVEPDAVRVDAASPYPAIVTFTVAQSGRCVVRK